MGYPELDRDESIILEAQNIKFKSISLDARLTTRRIILIDSKKNIIPPQEILLATIWQVEAGENAIRDHLLTLTIINNAGEKDQIVLTFPRLSGAERKRECNDWAKKLQSLIHQSITGEEPSDHPGTGRTPLEKQKAPAPVRGETAGRRPEKKRIEIARPLNKIIEPGAAPAVPVETSSLPSGIFCPRCGNRVPKESTFCNHCGTPIRQSSEDALAHIPDVPQVQIPVPPQAGSTTGRHDRPIEDIIHSIEPLIEDSVPHTQPKPLIKKRAPQIISEQVLSGPLPGPVSPETHAGPAPAGSQAEPATPVIWPVLQKTDFPLAPPPEPAPAVPESSPPLPPPPPASRLPGNLAIVLIVIVILAFIAGLIIASNLSQGQTLPGANATPAKTIPVITSATPKPTTVRTTAIPATISTGPTQVLVPSSGVWVRVLYPGTYTGLVGTPGNQKEVTETGDHVYSISTGDGIVAVSLQKNDGSSDKIVVEVYKNGVLVKSGSTVTPKGIVEIQFDLKSLQSSSGNATSTG
ncbi:MAG: zinc ribbon domain-containing protein [Methanoregula sp.]|jgi:hypothetical protein